ncbi:MAG TPA: response regulator [Spirochaetia bacterium]|nr:response regulator [Spirochaetales bacterium]HRS66341.1 response regulator [Spirochaetia bacterium]HOT60003.1 response regulator [Spirochaetales bacterium]HPD81261.1 response regulator [Spirochaetales bacterium]HQK35741.1 response regulator [Spirochaetales bacterium]
MGKKEIADCTVLIVEDDENNRIVIERLLKIHKVKQENIYVFEKDPLPQMLTLKRNFDIVFLDIQIPDKDGISIFKELKEDPRFLNSKIIALTANVMKQDVAQYKSVGFHGFIPKPIDAYSLKDTITAILDESYIWQV